MQLGGTDIRLLRVFDAVVRHRGFAAAQAELNIGQSTISNHIAALENRLGVTLCRRGRGGFRLTEKGAEVHVAVRRLLNALEGFVSDTSALRGRLAGTVRVGVVDSVLTDPNFRLPQAVAALEARTDAVKFEVLQSSPQALQTDVLSGAVHLGIGSFPHKVQGLAYRPLYEEVNTLYCARGHALFDVPAASVNAETLTRFKTVGRSYWRDDHRNNQHFVNTTAKAQGVEQQLMMILSGAFIGYVPDHAAAPWVAQGQLKQLRPDLFTYSCLFDVITRPGDAGEALTRAMLDEVCNAYQVPVDQAEPG